MTRNKYTIDYTQAGKEGIYTKIINATDEFRAAYQFYKQMPFTHTIKNIVVLKS